MNIKYLLPLCIAAMLMACSDDESSPTKAQDPAAVGSSSSVDALLPPGLSSSGTAPVDGNSSNSDAAQNGAISNSGMAPVNGLSSSSPAPTGEVLDENGKLLVLNPNKDYTFYGCELTGKEQFKYGRFEAKMKMAAISGTTDNYPTRYLVNDACVLLGKPNVYGSVFQFEGQVSVFYAKHGPCYRCLYREPPPPGLVPSCAEGGVLGVLPGVIGMLQATEVVKLLVGGGDTLAGRLLLYDAWKMKFRELKLEADPECPICGNHPTISKLIDYEQFCGMKTAQDDIPVESIPATELTRRFAANAPVQVIDLREPHDRAYFKFPNAKARPLGQVIRRQNELDPSIDTFFVC